MGTNHPSLPKSNWTFVRSDDKSEIYQNQFGILAEKHVLLNDPRLDEEQELNAYIYRCNSTKPIVKAYRADYESGGDFCSHYKNILVFIEYIPFRLIDTRELTHQQGLYVLSESLLGFHQLYCHLGVFSVNDTLIGFNKDGQVRVWHNANFAKNHFDQANLVLMSTIIRSDFDKKFQQNRQVDMVQDIWEAVDKHAKFNIQFRNHVHSLQQFNFYTLKEAVDEEIKRQPYVPPRLKFQDKYGIIQSSKMILSSSSFSRQSAFNNNPTNKRNWP